MSLFDQAFDVMTWKEVCYRLGGEGDLAVNALKRRITNLETLKLFFDNFSNVGKQPVSTKPLKEHINSILTSYLPADIFSVVGDEKYQPVLFAWMDKDNIARFRDYDPTKMGTKFVFNILDAKDQSSMEKMLEQILAEQEVNQQHLRAVLRKADLKCLPLLFDRIVSDSRPEVRANILSVRGLSSKDLVSDLGKVVGLKALAKCMGNPLASVNVLSMDLFCRLKPLERLIALERYMSFFPPYRKVKVFDPAPSKEEVEVILFIGCAEHDERVAALKGVYKMITEADPPEKEEE